MKLSRRETVLVTVGLAVVLLGAASEWGVRPLWARRQEILGGVRRAEQQLRTMRTLLERHRENRALLANVERRLIRRGDDFSLFTFLEEAAGRAGIRNRLVAMNPSASAEVGGYRRTAMVVRFDDLSMAQAVRYLKEIADAPRLLRVERLRLERSKRIPGRVSFTASVVGFAEGGGR